MVRAAKETSKIQGRIPTSLYKFVESEAATRGVDVTVVLIDALNFYKDHNLTPERAQDLVEGILNTKPELLDAPLMKAIEKNPAILEKIASHIGAMALNKQASRKSNQ